MSTPSQQPPVTVLTRLPDRVLILVAVVIVAVLASIVALFGLTPAAHRPDVWKASGVVLAGLGVSLPGILSWIRTETLRVGQQQTSQQLSTITAQTNGALDARIHSGVLAALSTYGASAAPAAVVIPSQRVEAAAVVIPSEPANPTTAPQGATGAPQS